MVTTQQVRNKRGIWGICPPENLKTLHRNFDIFETFKE